MKTACGTEHHALIPTSNMSGHHHDHMTAHQHHDNAMAMAMAMAGHDSAQDHAHPLKQKPANSVCSSCASCCVGALALSSIPILVPAYDGSTFVIATPAPLLASFVPAGLERPPKSFLA